MSVDVGNLQIMNVEVILESCPRTIPTVHTYKYYSNCCFCCCLHIKNRSDLYRVPFSFLLFKAKKRISVVTSYNPNKVQKDPEKVPTLARKI